MSKFLYVLIFAMVGVGLGASAANSGGDRKVGTERFGGGDGDDLFPWPWGTECPFPWQDIDGEYMVRSANSGPYTGHMLSIKMLKKDGSNVEFLTISEYNRQGEHIAYGRGYAQQNDRIVKGLITSDDGGRTYTVMIRTYVKGGKAACGSNPNLVTAITFCPLRGKKCMTDSNYLLERM